MFVHMAKVTCTNTLSNILLLRTYYNLPHTTIQAGQLIWGKLSKDKSRQAGEEEHYVKEEVYVIECRVQSPAICYPAKSSVLVLFLCIRLRLKVLVRKCQNLPLYHVVKLVFLLSQEE